MVRTRGIYPSSSIVTIGQLINILILKDIDVSIKHTISCKGNNSFVVDDYVSLGINVSEKLNHVIGFNKYHVRDFVKLSELILKSNYSKEAYIKDCINLYVSLVEGLDIVLKPQNYVYSEVIRVSLGLEDSCIHVGFNSLYIIDIEVILDMADLYSYEDNIILSNDIFIVEVSD